MGLGKSWQVDEVLYIIFNGLLAMQIQKGVGNNKAADRQFDASNMPTKEYCLVRFQLSF